MLRRGKRLVWEVRKNAVPGRKLVRKMASPEEPILSRLDRLDTMIRELDEIRGRKSWVGSSPSSGRLASTDCTSSVDFSPKSLEKQSRPMKEVMMEVALKGSLLERLDQLQSRVLKLCLMQVEAEIEAEAEAEAERKREERMGRRLHEKSFKRLFKSCVKSET
ncbi:uncharacterized protein LOC131165038 isoform X2 [Malania oleifera]|uniref:uncharacterized protein LOC131165038 isoform X2 n=1 Tax=Malania oleifera TaxID=397392 RepID=UPI0025AE6EE6|nr:uncharacterized protein LOC131165038 isoform X2 [Malania oleifera]